MMMERLRKNAHAWAKNTTGTRCASMGDCGGCPIRYCDYRSRVEAFMAGAAVSNDAKYTDHDGRP